MRRERRDVRARPVPRLGELPLRDERAAAAHLPALELHVVTERLEDARRRAPDLRVHELSERIVEQDDVAAGTPGAWSATAMPPAEAAQSEPGKRTLA